MAEKRMFAKKITNSDEFLELPISSQCLYFHLSMNADDDGFLNNWKSILRMTCCKEDDMKILIAKRFIIPFDTGVIVITHWRINNYLRCDRYTKTEFQKELSMLALDNNDGYELIENKKDTNVVGIPVVYPDKIREDKIREDKISNNVVEDDKRLPIIKNIISYLNEKLGTRYTHKAQSTYKHINARLEEGHTFEDFKIVIDKKYKDWKGTKFEPYLRPDTLFSTKFDGYLNQTGKFQTQDDFNSVDRPLSEQDIESNISDEDLGTAFN